MPKCKKVKKHTNRQQKNSDGKNLMQECTNEIPKLPSHYFRADTKQSEKISKNEKNMNVNYALEMFYTKIIYITK